MSPEETVQTSDWDPQGRQAWDNPLGTWDGLRTTAPAALSSQGRHGSGRFWSLTRFDDIIAAARDTTTFVNTGGSRFATRRPPLEADPPEHAHWRRLLMPYFSLIRMQALQTASRCFTTELLDQLILAGGGDAAHEFARPLPPRVLLTFLDQPAEDWAQIKAWCEDVYLQSAMEPDLVARFEAANRGLWDYSFELVAQRKAQPHDAAIDPVSGLLNARVDGEPLDEALVAGVVRLLIAAGHDSTTSAVGICLHYLARHTEDQQRLRSDPALIPAAVEEMLRLEAPVLSMPRIVAAETVLRGRELHKGDRVMLFWASGNYDPAAFEQPDLPVLDRKPNQHLAFGYGIHKCVGAPLARLELRVALEEWLRRSAAFGLAGEVTYEPWHRFGPRTLPVWISPAES
ncbi:MAG: cytochrome P450 [Chloroflexi bacterium]|nr:cytochrome P450 [Chloroflexota bacterium]